MISRTGYLEALQGATGSELHVISRTGYLEDCSNSAKSYNIVTSRTGYLEDLGQHFINHCRVILFDDIYGFYMLFSL